MSKRIRVSSAGSAGIVAGVVAALAGVGTAFAAGPVGQVLPAGLTNNTLNVIAIGMLIALVVVLVGGAVIALLAVGGSRFFHRNLPTDEEMAEVRAALVGSTSSTPRQPIRITPTSEPFVLAIVGFIVFFILGSIVLAGAPKPVQGNAEAAKPSASLPKTGDFTKIVAGLPAGNPANGPKVFNSAGCVGCHSLEKGKRLVGPSFYDVFDEAKTMIKGMGPKEYVYQSIVDPNAFIVPTYQPNIMPQTFANQLSPQQVSDVIAWLEKEHQGKS